MNAASDPDDDDDEIYIMSDDGMFVEQELSVTEARKKPYEVDFKSLDIAKLEAAQRVQIEHIAGMFVISNADAAASSRAAGGSCSAWRPMPARCHRRAVTC